MQISAAGDAPCRGSCQLPHHAKRQSPAFAKTNSREKNAARGREANGLPYRHSLGNDTISLAGDFKLENGEPFDAAYFEMEASAIDRVQRRRGYLPIRDRRQMLLKYLRKKPQARA